MNYEAWRISYQSSEQAARAAFKAWQAATEQGVEDATPEPVAYGMPNTAITGGGPVMMMVRNHIPSDDQYGGALLVPLYDHPPKPTGGGVPDGWSFKKQGDSILVQYHENGGFVKGRWIDKQRERFSFEFFDALLATQQPPEQGTPE